MRFVLAVLLWLIVSTESGLASTPDFRVDATSLELSQRSGSHLSTETWRSSSPLYQQHDNVRARRPRGRLPGQALAASQFSTQGKEQEREFGLRERASTCTDQSDKLHCPDEQMQANHRAELVCRKLDLSDRHSLPRVLD